MTQIASRGPGHTVVESGGPLRGATRHYQKHFRDLAGLYLDSDAYDALAADEGSTVVYEVYEYRRSEEAGDLIHGTTIMQPGRVGPEFFMTRGHRHRIGSCAEIYYGLSGEGVLLLEAPDGETRAEPLMAGTVVDVPPHWLHRSINTGPVPLVTLFCYPADAGQDYTPIEQAGGMRKCIVAAPGGGWELTDNPRHRDIND